MRRSEQYMCQAAAQVLDISLACGWVSRVRIEQFPDGARLKEVLCHFRSERLPKPRHR